MCDVKGVPCDPNNNNVKLLSLAHQNQEITRGDCQIVVPDAAVLIEKAFKSYGVGKWSSPVLCDLSMTIPKGSIYGLLGPSGCGKTTLLSCIVGQRSLDDGKILVFGQEPGIPGRKVGNMPQELALCAEFTIREAIEYFGRIYDLPPEFVKSQTEYLIKLLDLPSGNRRIGTLSGGQQRRVSFAVTIFHEPELLILDEPTVGVDSLLRQRIWDHLIQLNRKTGCTVIITTHYLEEASQTSLVGMMRSGRILVEGSPGQLMSVHNVPTLDDVFLKLCIEDDEHNKNNKELQPTKSKKKKKKNRDIASSLPSFNRLKALLYKDFTMTFRNFGLVFIIFFFPFVSIIAFFVAMGRDPASLRMAIVNSESESNETFNCNSENLTHYPAFTMLSCRYLHYLDNKTIIQVPFRDLKEAEKAAKNGHVWGVIHFGANFSQQLIARIQDGVNDGSLETIRTSQIGIRLDESNHLIKRVLVETTIDAFEKLFEEIQRNWGHEPDATIQLFKFLENEEEKKLNFADFVLPGLLLSLIYFVHFVQMASFIIIERNEGLYNRSLIAGANVTEMIMAHFAILFAFLIGQISMIYTLIIFVFKIHFKGNVLLASFITMLEGFSGMCLGLLVSTFCTDLKQILGLAVANYVITTFIGGIISPLECMPSYLRNAVYFLPETYPILSLRNVFGRGWEMNHPDVFIGVLSSCSWIIGLILLSAFIISRTNK